MAKENVFAKSERDPMKKKNVFAESKIDDEEIKKMYEEAKKELDFENEDLDIIFNVMMENRNILFPNQNKATEKECLIHWIEGYKESLECNPSQYVAKKKSTCNDPILKKLLMGATEKKEAEMDIGEKWHDLYMSGENILGKLLEEYINLVIKDYGWVWCRGETLRAVDFCTKDGKRYLQVKNKNNTENSASASVRDELLKKGLSIKKWYRLTSSKKGNPELRWEKLCEIINKDIPMDEPQCKMNEEEYEKFIKQAVKKNKAIVWNEGI